MKKLLFFLFSATLCVWWISITFVCPLNDNFPESIKRWKLQIETFSCLNGLDSNIVGGVILTESSGDPNAYSSSGAVGLMGIMASDGISGDDMCLNGKCFADRPPMIILKIPVYNIAYGTKKLAELVAIYGNIRDALYVYGPVDIGYSYPDIVIANSGN